MQWDKNTALARIQAIRKEVNPTGSITEEDNHLVQISEAVFSGVMSPYDGVVAAEKRNNPNRQDYH